MNEVKEVMITTIWNSTKYFYCVLLDQRFLKKQGTITDIENELNIPIKNPSFRKLIKELIEKECFKFIGKKKTKKGREFPIYKLDREKLYDYIESNELKHFDDEIQNYSFDKWYSGIRRLM